MRRVLLTLLFLGLFANPTLADPNNLAGGVLIAHNPPTIEYCSGNDWCSLFENHEDLIFTDASQQIPRIDDVTTYAMPEIWFVIAAFNEDKVWCGTQFGLGDYNQYVFYMTGSHGQCLEESLTIPTAGWPGPNTGISIVSTSTPWDGNYKLIYWFEGFTYLASEFGDMTPTVIPLTIYPDRNFMGFGNCESPAQVWPAEGGALGVFTDGIAVYPSIPGACCYEDGSCAEILMDDCTGVWTMNGNCDPNPCPQPLGACCFEDGSCVETLLADCQGDWTMFVHCDPNPCLQPTGACCYEDGMCEMTLEMDCEGVYHPDLTCNPNPCPQPLGACCDDHGYCMEMEEIMCVDGYWLMFISCDPNPCEQPVLRACCYEDDTCMLVFWFECISGTWMPDEISCDPNPCIPSSADSPSWGDIKKLYR